MDQHHDTTDASALLHDANGERRGFRPRSGRSLPAAKLGDHVRHGIRSSSFHVFEAFANRNVQRSPFRVVEIVAIGDGEYAQHCSVRKIHRLVSPIRTAVTARRGVLERGVT